MNNTCNPHNPCAPECPPQRGMLIIVSGPSGVGKDTIVNRYLEKNANASPSISATTREPRQDEVDGKHYFFITRNEVETMIQQGAMLEYAEYGSNYYGTPKKKVETMLESGKNVILVIEVQGAMKVKQQFPETVLIFLAPPSLGCLRQRLEHRGTENETLIRRRLEIAHKEIKQAVHYDYILRNTDIEGTADLLDTIITAAACSPKHKPDLVEGVISIC